MLYDKPLNCLKCKKAPRLIAYPMAESKAVFFKYKCKCGIETFGTASEFLSRELWCAGIERNKIKVFGSNCD